MENNVIENKIATVQKGVITFIWENGKMITLDCIVENEEYVEHDLQIISGMGSLESVDVAYGDEEVYPLCLECRTHLMKPKMVDLDGTNIEEIFECTNPECSNKHD